MSQLIFDTLLLVINLFLLCFFIVIFVYILYKVKQYCKSKDVREEKKVLKTNLGQILRESRIKCNMTQEFVAETIGVTRQAVSKWENGSSDPNTSNLIALGKLYSIDISEVLRNIQRENSK